MQDRWSGVWFAAPSDVAAKDENAIRVVECPGSMRAARSAAEELNWSAHNCRMQLREIDDARKVAA